MRPACFAISFALVGLLPVIGRAQKHAKPPRNSGYDSTYVLDYTHIITGRTYLSTKSNAFQLLDRETEQDLLYRPNNRVNLGLGASYRAYTLNIGIGFGFLNRDAQDKGETDYLDAQINYFSRHFATNVFFQVYKGYYLDSYTTAQLNWPNTVTRPFRADIRQANAGFSSLYIFNNERFSYRAAFNQDAWQRRSAGSFLAGAYLTYYSVQGDSTLMPSVLSARFDPTLNFDKASFLDFGAMGGYAHTFVIREHWFMTVSGALGIGGSVYRTSPDPVEGGTVRGRLHPGYHGQLRSAGGYNGRSICAAVSFNVETIMNSMGGSEAFQWTVGNLRLTVAKRFNKRLKTVDRVIKNVTGE
ncbi:MAG: DUF4421 domain-containing protein [Flavobacteriales bacterium]|nr:DUF4421 domain-containing protein [Flavobacteriales bacterium]